MSTVVKALDSGFVPVLHGDAVLDTSQGCTILSGDVIIRYLAEELKPEFVVFLVSYIGCSKGLAIDQAVQIHLLQFQKQF